MTRLHALPLVAFTALISATMLLLRGVADADSAEPLVEAEVVVEVVADEAAARPCAVLRGRCPRAEPEAMEAEPTATPAESAPPATESGVVAKSDDVRDLVGLGNADGTVCVEIERTPGQPVATAVTAIGRRQWSVRNRR